MSIVNSVTVAVQMDRTLTSEQKRIDFRPPEDLPPPLDKPTDACLFATALLTTAAKAVQQSLQGSNGIAFTTEVRRTRALPLSGEIRGSCMTLDQHPCLSCIKQFVCCRRGC